jgi:hypothetical protein
MLLKVETSLRMDVVNTIVSDFVRFELEAHPSFHATGEEVWA